MIAVVGVLKTVAGTVRLIVRGLEVGARVLTALVGGIDGMVAALTNTTTEGVKP